MIEVECHITIKKQGKGFLNLSKVNLLKAIEQTGSLSAAAKKLAISYQHAWNMIDELNSASTIPVVAMQRGGANGGGAEVTASGKRLLQEYQTIEQEVNKLIGKINTEIRL